MSSVKGKQEDRGRGRKSSGRVFPELFSMIPLVLFQKGFDTLHGFFLVVANVARDGQNLLGNAGVFCLPQDAQKVADGLKKEISDRDRAVSKQMDITKEKEKVIEGLQHQVSDLNQRIVNTDKALQDAKQDRDAYKANYEYFLSLPWYKRIFAK